MEYDRRATASNIFNAGMLTAISEGSKEILVMMIGIVFWCTLVFTPGWKMYLDIFVFLRILNLATSLTQAPIHDSRYATRLGKNSMFLGNRQIYF
jgi:hypothetical protein